MKCPKCGFLPSEETEECLKCGIVFKKYQAVEDNGFKKIKKKGTLKDHYGERASEAEKIIRHSYIIGSLFIFLGFALIGMTHWDLKWFHVIMFLLAFLFFWDAGNVKAGKRISLKALADLPINYKVDDQPPIITKDHKPVDHPIITKKNSKPLDRLPYRLNQKVDQPIVVKDGKLRCTRCGSNAILTMQEGYSFGKGIVGGLIFGPLGILAGGLESKKLNNICQQCGNKWKLN